MKEIDIERVEAMLFDLDDTLSQTTYANETALAGVLDLLKEDEKVEETMSLKPFDKRIREIRKMMGLQSVDASVFEVFAEQEALSGDRTLIATQLNRKYHSIYDTVFRFYPDVKPFLKKMDIIAMPMGLITNGNTYNQYEKIWSGGCSRFFMTISCGDKDREDIKEDREKPNPRAFLSCVETIQGLINKPINPKNTLYLGDRLVEDICGANNAGLTPVRVRRDGTLRENEEKEDFTVDEVNKKYPYLNIKTLGSLVPSYEIKSFKDLEKLLQIS